MADALTIARPYAKAAFDYALKGKAVQAWADMLALLATLVQDQRVLDVLHDPRRSAKERAEVAHSLAGDKAPEGAENFFRLMADYHRLPVLPEVSELFEQQKQEHDKQLQVSVTSAIPLTEAYQTQLVELLSNRFQKQVTLDVTVDDHLLGGLVIRAEDTVIDASIRGKLHRLAQQFID